MITLNKRTISILYDILHENDPIQIREFAERFKCSERTVRNDIQIVNTWLRHMGLNELEVVYGKGIHLVLIDEEKDYLRGELAKITHVNYDFNRDERVAIITFLLVSTNKKMTINQLTSYFYVSRSSIVKDLDVVENILCNQQLKLLRVPREGIWVEGEEFHKRIILIHLYKQINKSNLEMVLHRYEEIEDDSSPYIKVPQGISWMAEELQINKINTILSPLFTIFNLSLSDDAKATLYLHIGMSLKRIGERHVIDIDDELLSILLEKKEYEFALVMKEVIEEEFQVGLPVEEVAYITLHLLGKQNSPFMTIDSKKLEDNTLYHFIKSFIDQVEHLASIPFLNKEKLAEGLFVHLKPAIYRAKYGLLTENPLTKDIKERYTDLFQSVSVGLKQIETEYDILFNDEEISYITMHFGGAIPINIVSNNERIRIVIVCSSGIGTAQLLKRELLHMYDNIQIVETMSYSTYKNANLKDVDLIISTIDVENEQIPSVMVNAVLRESDLKKLNRFLHQNKKRGDLLNPYIIFEELWPIIQAHTDVKNVPEFSQQIISKLSELASSPLINEQLRVSEPHHALTLIDKLDENHIQVIESVRSWEECVYQAAEPLIQNGYVQEEFPDKIICLLKEKGPYMVVAPHVLLAHLYVEESESFGLTLTILQEGVSFHHRENDPVHIIITFVANRTNLDEYLLNELLEKLLNPNIFNRLLNANDYQEIVQALLIE